MRSFSKAALAALVTVSATSVAAPAFAQVQGLGVVDLQEAVRRSNAFTTAMTQIQTTYKAQIDQANTRRTAIQNELKPQVDAFEAARRAPNANQQALQTQYQGIQQREQAAQQELGRILQPVQLAQAYVNEQIVRQLEPALDRVMTARRLSVILPPDATVKSLPAAQVTNDLIAELNRSVPSVQITPPAGWQPGGQQAAPGAAAPAAAPATGTKPKGR